MHRGGWGGGGGGGGGDISHAGTIHPPTAVQDTKFEIAYI